MSTTSKAMIHAGLIKTRLQTAPAAGEIPTPLDITAVGVVIYEQQVLAAAIDAEVKKTTGCAIIIVWNGWTVLDKNASTPRLAHRYNVCVWSKPVIAANAYPADQVMESILNRLWQWVPVGYHAFGEAQVQDGGLVPDAKYLKYDVDVLIPVSH